MNGYRVGTREYEGVALLDDNKHSEPLFSVDEFIELGRVRLFRIIHGTQRDDPILAAYARPVVQAFRRPWCIDSGFMVHAFR